MTSPLPTKPPVIDFEIQNEGSIFLLRPLSEQANAWIDEHLPEDRQTFGGGVVVEHRYITSIIDGIQNDGLTIQAA